MMEVANVVKGAELSGEIGEANIGNCNTMTILGGVQLLEKIGILGILFFLECMYMPRMI